MNNDFATNYGNGIDQYQLGRNTNSFLDLQGANQFSWNIPSMELGLKGLNSLGSLWAAVQGLNQAKKEFAYNKRITDTNLRNSTQAYNTSLEDKIRARASANGNMSQAQVDQYIKNNSLRG